MAGFPMGLHGIVSLALGFRYLSRRAAAGLAVNSSFGLRHSLDIRHSLIRHWLSQRITAKNATAKASARVEKQNSPAAGFSYKLSVHGCLSVGIVIDQENAGVSWCERLYEANARQLMLYGRALGLSHSEAEDVLQETFVALLRRGEAPEKPEHYCVRSFRNHTLNYRRGLWRRLVRELESTRWFERDETESPQERAAMRTLESLPVEQREVIVLKIWHQYTFEEIGGILEISPNTAAGRYRYGLQKLKAYLRGEEYERLESVGEPIAFMDSTRPLSKA